MPTSEDRFELSQQNERQMDYEHVESQSTDHIKVDTSQGIKGDIRSFLNTEAKPTDKNKATCHESAAEATPPKSTD